jgi:hypothetical protein
MNQRRLKTPQTMLASSTGLLLLALALALAPVARAQNPQYMSYQGYLTDGYGNALGSTNTGPKAYDVVFRIWDLPTGGTIGGADDLFAELQTVTVDNGYFSVLLGQGTSHQAEPHGQLSGVFTSLNAPRYVEMTVLGIGVNGASVTILPRLQLVDAPYALLAVNAVNAANATNAVNAVNAVNVTGANVITAANLSTNLGLWQASGPNIYYNSGNVGIGTPAPSAMLEVNGPAQMDANLQVSGKVGIGTTSPSRALEVHNSGDTEIGIQSTDGGSHLWTLQSSGTNSSIPSLNASFQIIDRTAGASRFCIVPSGNVGIANSAPETTLHVGNYLSSDQYITVSTEGGNQFRSGIKLRHFNSGTGVTLVSDERDNTFRILSHFSGDTNGIPLLIVSRNTGYVGIGTNAPGEMLDVDGFIRGRGFRCRSGTNGFVNVTNAFNFQWTGSALQAWIDNLNVATITPTSDRRLKEDIQPLANDALNRVMALKPSTFKYKEVPGSIFHGDGQVNEGFIADELQQVIPSAVNGEKDALTKDGQIQPQTLNIIPVVSVLTKATQEQQQTILRQQQEIEELKAAVHKLAQSQWRPN